MLPNTLLAPLAALPILLAFPAAGAPSAPAPQDPPVQQGGQGDQGGQGQGPSQTLVPVTELDRLMAVYAKAHGGKEKLDGIRTMAFELTPALIEEGEERAGKPLKVSLLYSGPRRAVRIEDEIEGLDLVKISDGLSSRVWVGEEERQIPEINEAALQEARRFLSLLDLILRPEGDDLLRDYDGIRQRDGVSYFRVNFGFHPSRQIPLVFRLWYNEQTALVERMDEHDARNNMRVETIRLSGYEDLGGVKFPTRFVFHDRKDDAFMAWTFSNLQLNPEIPYERFDER